MSITRMFCVLREDVRELQKLVVAVCQERFPGVEPELQAKILAKTVETLEQYHRRCYGPWPKKED